MRGRREQGHAIEVSAGHVGGRAGNLENVETALILSAFRRNVR